MICVLVLKKMEAIFKVLFGFCRLCFYVLNDDVFWQ